MSNHVFDVIVIGAGPGGAPCAALLAKRGFNVLLLEKNNDAGGKAMTMRKQGFAYEMWPITGGPVYGSRFEQLRQELGFETSFGLQSDAEPAIYYYLDCNGRYRPNKMPQPSLITDPAKLAEAGQKAFLDMMRWLQIEENEIGSILQLASDTAALTNEDLGKLDDISYHEYLSRYKVPQSFYSFCGMASNIAYAVPIDQVAASEYILTDRRITLNTGYYSKGGYGRLFERCVELLRDLGGTAKFEKSAEKIIVENGRVKGVATSEGTFYAHVVVSNAGIQPTVLKLVGKEYFDSSYIKRIESLVPSFGAMGTRYFLNRRFFAEPFNLIFSDNSYLNIERMQRIDAGKIPEDLLIFNVIPSNFDPDLAQDGKQCVLSLIFCPPDPDFEYNHTYRQKLDECMERAWPGFLSHVEFKEYYSAREISKLTREPVLPGVGGECIGLGQIVGQCGKHKPNPASPLAGLFYVGCDSGGRGVGTHQGIDSAFNVADMVEKHIRACR